MSFVKELYNYDDWVKKGKKLFGEDGDDWRFKCPACGITASVGQWRATGCDEGEVAYSCIGNSLNKRESAFFGKRGKGPCDYTGRGMFKINPVIVVKDDKEYAIFNFADSTLEPV